MNREIHKFVQGEIDLAISDGVLFTASKLRDVLEYIKSLERLSVNFNIDKISEADKTIELLSIVENALKHKKSELGGWSWQELSKWISSGINLIKNLTSENTELREQLVTAQHENELRQGLINKLKHEAGKEVLGGKETIDQAKEMYEDAEIGRLVRKLTHGIGNQIRIEHYVDDAFLVEPDPYECNVSGSTLLEALQKAENGE